MNDPMLSPKAQQRSTARHRMWQPRLKRTKNHLVMLYPTRGSREQRRELTEAMGRLGWKWSDKRRYYYADLGLASFDAAVAEFRVSGYIQLNISQGVWDWLEEQEED
jgi:hypothetical protein